MRPSRLAHGPERWRRCLGVGLTTLQRWRRQFTGDGDGLDGRKGSHRLVSHRLTDEERQRILLTSNQSEFAAILADRGIYIGSERSFYRVLHVHGQAHRRGRARQPQEPRPVPRLQARGPNQVWSWDITYLPTSVRGVWLYLDLVIDQGALEVKPSSGPVVGLASPAGPAIL